jgi:hypothetical protein
MKNFYFPILLFAFIFLAVSCKKNVSIKGGYDFVAEAKSFFYSEVKMNVPESKKSISSIANPSNVNREPIWSLATTKTISGKTVIIVPLKYDSLFYVSSSASGSRLYLINEVTRLCMYKDSLSQFHAEVITIIPDNAYFVNKAKSLSGLLHVDAWDGTALHSYLYSSSGAISAMRSSTSSISNKGRVENDIAENAMLILETCYYFEGYNYSPGIDELGCETEVIDYGESGGGGGLGASGYSGAVTGGGSGGSGAPVNPVTNKPVVSGNNIIGNINDYNKCFTNVAGNSNTYTVTLCVDQPVPGRRDPWGFAVTGSSSGSSLINVGHTFLIFTEGGSRETVQRNVGFYPADYVTPVSPSDPGQLNNDNGHNYNISLTVTLDNSQFFNMLNYVSAANSSVYNLNNNNCTSFALRTLAAGNVDISTSFGTWAGGGGYDPGDLGEDIRQMTLQSGMTKSTIDVSHPNLGTCN